MVEKRGLQANPRRFRLRATLAQKGKNIPRSLLVVLYTLNLWRLNNGIHLICKPSQTRVKVKRRTGGAFHLVILCSRRHSGSIFMQRSSIETLPHRVKRSTTPIACVCTFCRHTLCILASPRRFFLIVLPALDHLHQKTSSFHHDIGAFPAE